MAPPFSKVVEWVAAAGFLPDTGASGWQPGTREKSLNPSLYAVMTIRPVKTTASV
ncbi:MAG: hypothetical protein ABI409_15200 [Ramlibacter sp.]